MFNKHLDICFQSFDNFDIIKQNYTGKFYVKKNKINFTTKVKLT